MPIKPKGQLTVEAVKEIQRTAYLVYNYPPPGTGSSIPVPAEVLYKLCRDWLECRTDDQTAMNESLL